MTVVHPLRIHAFPAQPRAWLILPLLVVGGCGDVAAPSPTPGPDASRGEVAFRQSCAPCHASRDGYDLALFGFPEFDIVRRGVAHVDTATARDIAAHIRSIPVTPAPADTRLFQPGDGLIQSDVEMWEELFGTTGWPASLDPVDLAAVDPRKMAIPLGLPTWSNEQLETDWMPERPLPVPVLEAEGGIVGGALDAYYASPSLERLTALLDAFRQVTEDREDLTSDKLCRGEAATHPEAEDCFEARRWMSSLAALHLLRYGMPDDLPTTVVRTWWETGEAATSVRFGPGSGEPGRVRAVAQWLYLGFTFGPDEFQERNGYVGQHLQNLGYERLAVFSYLRRMVGSGRAQQGHYQRYIDGWYAVGRAPAELVADVAKFAFEYLLTVPNPQDPEDRTLAANLMTASYNRVLDEGVDPTSPTVAEVGELHDRLVERLGG